VKRKGESILVLNYVLNHYAMKINGGEGSTSRPGRFTPVDTGPVSIGEEAGWAIELVWTLLRRENHLPLSSRPARSQIAIPTKLKWGNVNKICANLKFGFLIFGFITLMHS
jgi:hypothetical protein